LVVFDDGVGCHGFRQVSASRGPPPRANHHQGH
jgi:hypothetical protein